MRALANDRPASHDTHTHTHTTAANKRGTHSHCDRKGHTQNKGEIIRHIEKICAVIRKDRREISGDKHKKREKMR